ncbi:hypothetical protein P5673_009267, partial [Acropora cervicornis]
MERSRKDDTDRSISQYAHENKLCSCGSRSTLNVHTFLAVSFLFNIIFVVLFVLVFMRLNDVQTRVEKLESSPGALVDRSRFRGKERIAPLPKTNSTHGFSVVNVTGRPLLIQSMPSVHISKRSTSQAHPTQPPKEKKKVPKSIRDYVKRMIIKFATDRMKSASGKCPSSCK